MVKIHFFGGCREVGGSAILIQEKNTRVLLDCGIYLDEEVRIPPIVDVHNLDGVVVTHAHLDHSGGTPALYVSGSPKLWTTPLTLDIMNILISGVFCAIWYFSVDLLAQISFFIAYINAFLALFNLIPFGPLDGWKILSWKKELWVVLLITCIGLLLLLSIGKGGI